MLDNLTSRLARIVKTIRGEARLTESNVQDALREVRLALLEADVALPVVKDFIAAIRAQAMGQEVVGSLTPGQALVGVVHRELTRLMGEANVGLDLATQPPAVILMAGLQGSGTTTPTGTLARRLRERHQQARALPVRKPGRPHALLRGAPSRVPEVPREARVGGGSDDVHYNVVHLRSLSPVPR